MLDRYIAKQIIFAQLASDGGKKDKEVLNRISSFVPLSEVQGITQRVTVSSMRSEQYSATRRVDLDTT